MTSAARIALHSARWTGLPALALAIGMWSIGATQPSSGTPAGERVSATATPRSAATEDGAYRGSIAGGVSDPDAGDTLTFSKVSGPAWLIVAGNGALSGTPKKGNMGLNHFVVRVTDAGGLFDDASMTITVNPAPGNNAAREWQGY